ncbi:hypothetical protein NIES2100_06630 [Calothrix sp. NIES-2100]|nr:hypothetical protein NIES2100_06630 [Calothrix sp. NIES-2100]
MQIGCVLAYEHTYRLSYHAQDILTLTIGRSHALSILINAEAGRRVKGSNRKN